MRDRLRFLLRRLRERLWIKPLAACLLSVAGVLLAHLADRFFTAGPVPDVSQDSVIELLKITAASMLGVATFAVASMVSAYASAGQIATARAFPLIVADDVSQNALSIFVGAFIFSVVGISATMNGYYGRAGRFTLFVLMVLVLMIVVLTFVRWVDRIARLGRVGAIVAKVEHATAAALARRRRLPFLGGIEATGTACGSPVYGSKTGYLQHIDVTHLQRQADKCGVFVRVEVLPGAFVSPNRPLCYLQAPQDQDRRRTQEPEQAPEQAAAAAFAEAFTIGPQRQFDDDPRFGLLVLSEVACRALSPGINDAGTAIGVLGSMHRLLGEMAAGEPPEPASCERVALPALPLEDLFNDAFNAIARDGARTAEVMLRLLRHLGDLGTGDARMAACARHQADLALARAGRALDFPYDLAQVRARHAEFWGPS